MRVERAYKIVVDEQDKDYIQVEECKDFVDVSIKCYGKYASVLMTDEQFQALRQAIVAIAVARDARKAEEATHE